MGHVDLAAPVSHIWFFKGVPSRIGYLIDMAPKELEKVLYFAASIITHVDDEARTKDLTKLEKEVNKVLDAHRAEREQRARSCPSRSPAAPRGSRARTPGRAATDEDELWAETPRLREPQEARRRRAHEAAEGSQEGTRLRDRRHRGLHRRRDRAYGAGLGDLPDDEGEGGHQRRGRLPRAQGALRLPVRLGRVLPRRHGRRVDPRPPRAGRPRGGERGARADDQHVEGPEAGSAR